MGKNSSADWGAASIWFKIWGSWIQAKIISIFPGKFRRNFDFSRQIFKKFRFFQANFKKISIFSGNLKQIQFSRQKLLIYSYFWANYSISLQKSPLSNTFPVHDKI